jgi:hypothetical protein
MVGEMMLLGLDVSAGVVECFKDLGVIGFGIVVEQKEGLDTGIEGDVDADNRCQMAKILLFTDFSIGGITKHNVFIWTEQRLYFKNNSIESEKP